MTEIGLEFLPNDGGEAEGLSDAGIETFRDNPFAAVARETGQNSRDARDDASLPVRVTFDVIEEDSTDFPSIDVFRTAARLCYEKSERNGNERDRGFFRNAMAVLNEPKLRIMRISDFNTKGVRGPFEEGRPFHTLAKGDGLSVKDEISSGGSFGIGKNATFALSDIQTVFISTKYSDESGESQVLCMGKTQFISHTGLDGKEKRRKAYWGRKDGYKPLDNPRDIPDWLLRDQQGTSIFSICMRGNRVDWRYEMTAAILINFFCAIERQEMEFEIDSGTIKINKGTIQSLFKNESVLRAAKDLSVGVALNTARILHLCEIDSQKVSQDFDIEGLGTIRMQVLLREGLEYTIGIIRNGMYITDNLSHFDEPFKRFPLYREFAALVEPVGSTEGEWFKRLENPRHDSLSADRITDPALRQQGQRLFEKLAKEIRGRIRELAKSEVSNTLELNELNEFFASDESRIEDDAGTETDPRSRNATPIRRSDLRKPRPAVTGQGKTLGPGPEPESGSSGPGPGSRPGTGKRPRELATPVKLGSDRALMLDPLKPNRRRLIFTPPVTGDLIIYTDASGLNSSERLTPIGVSRGRIIGNAIELSCTDGERMAVDVEFDAPYPGPVEVSAYRLEGETEEPRETK